MTTTFSGLVQDRGFNTNNGLVVTASTLTIDPAVHAGRLILCSLAAGQTYTLPPTSGNGQVYTFHVAITYTGNGIIKVANSVDVMVGFSVGSTLAGTGSFVEGVGTTDDTITLNGTTTGGLIGTYIVLKDYAPGFWRVDAHIIGSGTMVTSFSATV